MAITDIPVDDLEFNEDLILSLCIARRISPADLERLAMRLAHLEAYLDAQNQTVNHYEQNTYRN